mmetsp:Transcript_60435/g.142564  ORF Transcript_60435/g.142564 Transcript_60435/m.142564 type:complete len:273 (+) Transcript_60435:256-1074(+)
MLRGSHSGGHAQSGHAPMDVDMSDAETEFGYAAEANRPHSAETVDMDVEGKPQMIRALYGMPEDCFVHVLKFLSAEQLCLCASVCSEFQRLTASEQFWQKLCTADYGADAETLTECYGSTVDKTKPAYWKRIYRELIDYRIELHFTGGPRAGDHQVVPKDVECMLGRSRQNNVCILHDEMVSRRHAKIVHKDRHYWIHDVGGINRTFINKRVIKQHSDIRLFVNDEVDMGSSTFLIKLVGPDAAAAAAALGEDSVQEQQATITAAVTATPEA